MIKRETIHELKKKLDAVFQAYVRIEEELRKEIVQIPWEKIPDSDASKAYIYLEYMLANISRQSFLTMVCSWLEMAMDVIGEAYFKADDEVVYMDEVKKRKGSWFDKRIKVFRDYCDAFGEDMTDQLQFIEHVLQVRNCIVHAGGRVENDDYPDQVDEAIKWIWEKAKESNFKFARIRNGLIYLGDHINAEMVIVSRKIIDHLLDHA